MITSGTINTPTTSTPVPARPDQPACAGATRAAVTDTVDLCTADRLADVGLQVMSGQLSDSLSSWVERYATVGQRPGYLWKWCRRAVEITTLPCVPAEIREDVCDTKTLGVMWDVMLDDLADQGGNPELLDELLNLPLGKTELDPGRFTPDELAYGRFTCDVWNEIMERVQSYPLFGEYEALLRFDYLQLCNVMRYSHLVNESIELLNLTEHDLYTPHNMHIMVCSTVDLMVSPTFNPTEVGHLRHLIWHAQWMGRIGNLVTTWEREVGELDFTSGVFARALDRGDLVVRDLLSPDPERIRSAIVHGGHEEFYLRKWTEHRDLLMSGRDRVQSFDIGELVRGLDELICLHLASRGRK